MALLMVHLRAAQAWAARHSEFAENPDFYFGAISPDAIHIRDGNDKSRKDEIHLYNWREPHPENVLAYWEEHSSPFDVGYGLHVLTDAQWVPQFRQRFPQLLDASGKINTAVYYNDNYVTDFQLYADGGRELLELTAHGVAPEDHPLLTKAEFDQWRALVEELYRGACPKHDPVQCFDRAYAETFIEECQPMLDDVWRRFQE